MAGPRKENGSRGDAKKDNGRTTVYRKKERKTPSQMDRWCGGRPEGEEDKAVDKEGDG